MTTLHEEMRKAPSGQAARALAAAVLFCDETDDRVEEAMRKAFASIPPLPGELVMVMLDPTTKGVG